MQAERSTGRTATTGTEVADGVIMISSGPGVAGTSNAAIVLHPDHGLDPGHRGGATVVDSFLLPSMAAEIDARLRARSVRAGTVLNTHPHADHVGGNAVFESARVVSDRATADSVNRLAADPALLARLFPRHADELTGIRLRVPGPLDPPVLGSAAAAGRVLAPGLDLWRAGPAHTPADLIVHLPGPGVLIAGDLCFNQVTPMVLPGHADVAGWIAALDHLIALEPAVVVPGHGPVGDVDTLRAVRAWLSAVLSAAREAVDRGVGLPDAMNLFEPPAATGGWAEPERCRLALAVALAEVSGDPGHLPAGVPTASRGAGPPRPPAPQPPSAPPSDPPSAPPSVPPPAPAPPYAESAESPSAELPSARGGSR